MTKTFDAADYLTSPETIAAYLTEALDTNDSSFVAVALETVARAQCRMPNADKSANFDRIAKSLAGQVRPDFETIRKALSELGVRLVVEPVRAA